MILSLCLFASLVVGLASSYQEPLSTGRFPSLIDVDLEYLQDGLELGIFTSLDLVTTYTLRIHEVNSTLHAVTEINPDAIAIAKSLDKERREGKIRGPLHGIPVLIKNNIATNDRLNNTAGSWALVGAKTAVDATVAAKLRLAGAIILGKTNLSQWANYRSSNTSHGWSSHGGQTYGAYYPGQDPSGSSSGSGVATSIGLVWASLGTETAGSIVVPASNGNLVGIKPTVGLTSRFLVIPVSEHQDTVGPMARSVKDAAYLLQAIAGPDGNDNYTSAIPYQSELPEYVAACRADVLQGARLGVAWNVLDSVDDPAVLSAFNTALGQMRQAGATIVDANFTAYDKLLKDPSKRLVMDADFSANLASYLSKLTVNPANISTLANLSEYTHLTPLESWPTRDTKTWDGILARAWDNTDPRFWPVYRRNLFYGGEGGILGALARTNTTAILLPTSAMSYIVPALVGSPIITVPLGFYPPDTPVKLNPFGTLVARAPGLPFGLSFLGAKWSEPDLIGLAYAYEQRSMHRYDQTPYLAPNIELEDVVGMPTSVDVFQSRGQFDLGTTKRSCSLEWIQRCESVERRPRELRELGVLRPDP